MYIDTNREPSECPDDRFAAVATHTEVDHLREEEQLLWTQRRTERKMKTWTWTKEEEFRAEVIHLRVAIKEAYGFPS